MIFNIKHKNLQPYNFSIYLKIERFLNENSKFINGKIIDLGCGEMNYKFFLLRYAEQYFGVDWGSSFHEIKADLITDLNYPIEQIESESFNTVFSISVLEHLSNPENLISESYRILKPGGHILLQIPFQWRVHEIPFDFQRYTNFGLELLFKNNKFKQVQIIPTNGVFLTIALKINYLLLNLVRGPKLIRIMLKLLLTPFWVFNQIIALAFDNLDKNWNLETQGYWVIAKK